MSTAVLVKKLNKEIVNLREEVRWMRGALMRILADEEGEYRPEFVEKLLAREKEPARFTFSTKADFLKHVRAK